MISAHKLSSQEMKILVYKKIKEGLTYEEAKKEVARDLRQVAYTKRKKESEDAIKETHKIEDFKDEFKKLKGV